MFDESPRDTCPMVAAIRIVGNETKLIVVRYLMDGDKGFNVLKRSSGMNSKTLSSTLKSLENDGIVNREIVSTRPFKVSYSLTEKGRDLKNVLESLGDWARKWHSGAIQLTAPRAVAPNRFISKER